MCIMRSSGVVGLQEGMGSVRLLHPVRSAKVREGALQVFAEHSIHNALSR